VAQAALAKGYDEVIITDGHGNAHNIDPDLLPENVWLVRSWPRPLLQMQGVEDPNIEACAFVGYHAGSTSQDGVLAHTYHGGCYRAIKLNGEFCSEGYLNAALAGEFGKPVILVSGDQHTIQDAERYAPGAVMYVSKHALGGRSQLSLPPKQVQRSLGEAAAIAFDRPLQRPFVVEGPFRVELEMVSSLSAEMLAYLPGVERKGPWSIQASFDCIAAVMRFISFAMLYSPTGAIAL